MAATPAFTPNYGFVSLPLTDRLEVLTDQLELALNGGQSTDDSAYPRAFLRLCIEQAKDKAVADTETANLAINQADYLTRKKDEIDSYFTDLKAKTDFWETPDRWIQRFPVALLFDADRGQQYFVLPQALVNLRRYQNLPSEGGVRDMQARNVLLQPRYRFAHAAQGTSAYQRLPGGSLGRWLFTIEHNTAIVAAADSYRCYLRCPKFNSRIPDDVLLDMFCVIRDDRASGLPAPPLQLVEDYNIIRYATELAILRTRQDKIIDANPQPTQAQQ